MERSLKMYDVEVVVCDPSVARSDEEIWKVLHQREETFWHKAVFRESMCVYSAPRAGLESFRRRVDDLIGSTDEWHRTAGVLLDADGMPAEFERAALNDGQAVVILSRLDVWMLPAAEEALVRENQFFAQTAALHTHPMAAGFDAAAAKERTAFAPVTRESSSARLRKFTHTHSVEGFVDKRRKQQAAASGEAFGWDDVVVLLPMGMTYHDLNQRGLKYSPRDVNVSRWIMDHIYYKQRKVTKFINAASKTFEETVSFDEERSVRTFVTSNSYFNNTAAAEFGLKDVFIAVANNGAFFRAAHTRREINYWLPGLNAGIPFVAKKDPIHEITFTAHDFGHFLIPDLIYTGNNSSNARRAYIIYRMLSEAVTMCFADMLFVETLRLSGYEYDWKKRCIHPLFIDTGVQPFAKDQESSRNHFLNEVKKLLDANVTYCLLGDDSAYKALIEANRGADFLQGGTCPSLAAFKEKYMPFFVEDFRWTSANFNNMSKRGAEYRKWWELVRPIIAAAGLDGMRGGVGLETVDQHLEALGISPHSDDVPSAELVHKVFGRVFDTRLVPVLTQPGGYTLAPQATCLKTSFARYLAGQMIVFARYDFVQPDASLFSEKVISRFVACADTLTVEDVETIRSLYSQFLRVLLQQALITPDDYENWQQICPLFDPVYVFYDESKSFYQELAEVQRLILEQ